MLVHVGRLCRQRLIERCHANSQACCGLAHVEPLRNQDTRIAHDLQRDHRLAAALAPAGSGRGQPGACALTYEITLVLSQS